MFKTKLQELCHRHRWPLPEYTTGCEAMPHDLRFTAAVAVDGQTFRSYDFSPSSKEAQNKAAEVAYSTLSAVPLPPPAEEPDPVNPAIESKIPFKNQLQNYAQKKSIDLPVYSYFREGSSHSPRFMASVKFDGQTFDSDQYYHTIKAADQAAARIALMSLPMEETQQDDGMLYKSLLLELAQKGNVSLPKYKTTSRGECHMPIFSSVVEIKGEIFEGDPAKTKKQAEMNAAKVAWNQLNDRKLRNNPATSSVSGNLEKPIKVALNDEDNMESSKLPPDEQKTASASEGTIKLSMPSSNDNATYLQMDTHSAARVVLMQLPKEEVQQDDGVLCKSLLHELAQKESIPLPKYSTSSRGDCHMPIFSSVVEIKGEFFEGDPAKTKKQAEVNAAKVAWCKLRNNPATTSVSVNLGKPIKMTFNDEDKTARKLSSEEQETASPNKSTVKLSMSSSNDKETYLHRDNHSAASANMNGQGIKRNDCVTSFQLSDLGTPTKDECIQSGLKSSSPSINSALPHPSSPASTSSSSIISALPNPTCPASDEVGATLLCNRVRVYPRKFNMVLPEGATLLPIRDDMWVAVQLN